MTKRLLIFKLGFYLLLVAGKVYACDIPEISDNKPVKFIDYRSSTSDTSLQIQITQEISALPIQEISASSFQEISLLYVQDTVPATGKQAPIVKPKIVSKQDLEDTDFIIKKPAYQYNLNKAPLKKGEKFHSSRRAWMLSAVLPGAGQIYNRRYWKLPIVYGGFVGLGLIINFNQIQYNKTLQYYKILLVDQNSKNVPIEYQGVPLSQISSIKDFYRRNRDLSIIGTGALLVAGIVDAFVDSELKGFDVSNKLSMHISPWVQPSVSSNLTSLGNEPSYGLKLAFVLKH